MKRCEVWWADLPPPIGRRPVLLLSRDEAYAVRNQVTVAPVTTRIRRIPVEVELGPQDGLPKRCVVNLDSIVTVPKSQLRKRVALLRPERIGEVEAAIRFALGFRD
ncbi:MAG: type II toxin-antitoxin system PemK/MazF family toxin [bacterium]|nr:type II toxin-antitoxin system PemK/MazF family toxin [bacterium]